MAEFTHLHLHTEYSLLDGACDITKLVDRVAALGQKSVAMTDHGNIYGAVHFFDAAKAKGIAVTKQLNHDDSPTQSSEDLHAGVFVRSVYFFDPDGVCLEFAAWTKGFDQSDVAHDPMSAQGTRVRGMVVSEGMKLDEAMMATAK